ncbi:hypothetical protein SDC9_158938 [bioreactor metagenome]|uniref:Uncharacterized protein n=1 Tax=bioreactor metagenome TaxID=1076179 RepID=A0A645FGL7_9ZZZZ
MMDQASMFLRGLTLSLRHNLKAEAKALIPILEHMTQILGYLSTQIQ